MSQDSTRIPAARTASDTLTPGTVIDAYRIKSTLGSGGFGVTYRVEHVRLGKDFAMKEYFPRAFAVRDSGEIVPRSDGHKTYEWGLARFLDEARALARFHHPAIVGVSNVFEANGTAYMVLTFEDGATFGDWLAGLGRPPAQAELDAIAVPILDALATLHGEGLLHRDIAPDNIYVRRNGTPVLLDFGAARKALSDHSAQMSAIVKIGYSPPEQYSTEAQSQGPWSDIYAVGATLYAAVTGKRPPDANSRWPSDPYVPVGKLAPPGYRADFLEAIDAALKLDYRERPPSIAAWRRSLMPGGADRLPDPDPTRLLTPGPTAAAPAASWQPARVVPPVAENATAPVDPTRVMPVDIGPVAAPRPGRSATAWSRPAQIAIGLVAMAVGLSQLWSAFFVDNIKACDTRAAIPDDPKRQAPGLDDEAVDLGAIAVCRKAVAQSVGRPDAPRLDTQLARLLELDGNAPEAVAIMRRAAERGYPEAVLRLGGYLYNGIGGLTFDRVQGCRLVEQAVNAGHVGAKTDLSYCLEGGSITGKPELERAFALQSEAAGQGSRSAMAALASAYASGNGTPFDLAKAYAWNEKAAALGSVSGIYSAAAALMHGEGVAADKARGLEMFRSLVPRLRRLAERRDTSAMELLAGLSDEGWGLSKDPAAAAGWYRRAMDLGSSSAKMSYAVRLRDGNGVAENKKEALRLFREAAERGSSTAMTYIGLAYAEGTVVAKDEVEALGWYRKAAALGETSAMRFIAEAYENGTVVQKSAATAIEWYQRAADHGSGDAMARLGEIFDTGTGVKKNEVEARRWFERGAARGHVDSLNYLGVYSSDGRGGGAREYAKALSLWQRAAALGSGAAMFNIGEAYEEGNGVAKDERQARGWHTRAAEAGYASGMLRIGSMLEHGRGGAVDLPAAYGWYVKAGEAGNSTGMWNAGVFLEEGRGVAASCKAAAGWYRKAAEAGHDDARKRLPVIAKKC